MANDTTMILSARGAFYQVSLADASTSSRSVYAVEHLTINPPMTQGQSPILITGVRTQESDIVSRVPCLNNYKVYYSFGQNFGNITVTGEVLLGPTGDVDTMGVAFLRNFFTLFRVSNYEQTIAVNDIDRAYNMFLEGMQIMELDKEFNILPFALFGTMVDPSRTTPPKVNPGTVVLSDVNLDDASLAAALSVVSPEIPTATAPTDTIADQQAAFAAAAANTTPFTNRQFGIQGLTALPDSANPAAIMGLINTAAPANAYNAFQRPGPVPSEYLNMPSAAASTNAFPAPGPAPATYSNTATPSDPATVNAWNRPAPVPAQYLQTTPATNLPPFSGNTGPSTISTL